MGHLAYYAAWEHVYHLCGGTNWLAQFAISHWAFGPSAILERVSERAAAESPPGPHGGGDDDVLRHVGARRRLRRHHAAHPGRARRRRLAAERSQDLDHARAHRRLDDRRSPSPTPSGPRPAGAASARSSCPPTPRASGSSGSSACGASRADRRRSRCSTTCGSSPGSWSAICTRASRSASRACRSAASTTRRRSVGLSRWAIEQAVEYTKSRQAFGKPISEYQGVSFPLADGRHRDPRRPPHGPQRGDAARPGPPGDQGAVDGQGLRRAGRRAGRRPGHPDLRRPRLHQRDGPHRGVPHAAASSTSPTARTRSSTARSSSGCSAATSTCENRHVPGSVVSRSMS